MSSRGALFVVAMSALVAGCSGSSPGDTGSGGGSPTGAGGAGSGGGGASAVGAYRDLDELFRDAVAPTCSLNQGVCHSSRAYPELSTLGDLVKLVGAPCQLGAQDSKQTLDVCEVTGDSLFVGGKDVEILDVVIDDAQPFPPLTATLVLASAPASLDPTGAKIHRLGKGGMDEVVKPLAMVPITAGTDGKHVVLDASMDEDVAHFIDLRAWTGDRVRVGDPNENGMAHSSASPWSEIVAGDPARSFFYRRLLNDKYGPSMPLIPRSWSPGATRALFCFIRGLPKDASAMSIDPSAAIDYASCPIDPDAPDPNATGGWPAVRSLVGSRCATVGCHASSAKSAGLDLTPDPAVFAADVLNAKSSQVPGSMRVVPGQPAASYLLCKVKPDCDSRAAGTKTMPQTGTPLTEAEIETISSWILNGAPLE